MLSVSSGSDVRVLGMVLLPVLGSLLVLLTVSLVLQWVHRAVVSAFIEPSIGVRGIYGFWDEGAAIELQRGSSRGSVCPLVCVSCCCCGILCVSYPSAVSELLLWVGLSW